MTAILAKKSNRGSKKGERRGGRKKGTQNKFTADVKSMVLEALSEVGGVDYLVKQATANPTAFMTLVGKILPLTVSGDPNNPISLQVKFVGNTDPI